MRYTGVSVIERRDSGFDEEAQVVRTAEPFSQFYDREFRRVVALAYVLSGSQNGAEDLAQDGFLAAYRDWDGVGTHPNPGAWVRRVVANRSVSMWRRRMAEVRAAARLIPSSGLRPEEMDPVATEVWSQVRRLPKRQAQALALRYLEDLPVDQIAEVLECSSGSVKQHLHRGQRALAHRLGEEDIAHER
jgi:RNA polymerase sigma-70 factor (ECF subfamily)